jgi:hypothetical protein
MILLFIILVRSFDSLTVGGKVCAILYIVPSRLTRLLTVAIFGYFLHPVYENFLSMAIVVTFALAQGISSRLSRLEIAFVVLALVANVGKAIINLIVSITYVRTYKEWLLTYTMKSMDDSKEQFRAPWNRWIAEFFKSLSQI